MQVPSLDSEDQKFQRILVYIFRRLSFNAGGENQLILIHGHLALRPFLSICKISLSLQI